jgi:trigger factor
MRPQAEKQVKIRLALEKIAELEALTVADEEVEAEYTRISEAYNVPVDEVKKMVMAEDIKADLLVAAAMNLVKDNAVVTAKKTAAKKTASTKKADAAEAAEPEKTAAKKTTTKKTAAKTADGEAKPATKKTTTKKKAETSEDK